MERELNIGDDVNYVDEYGVKHTALVTQTWLYGKKLGDYKAQYGQYPSLNVVYVTREESKSDPYGHQIERATSVVYKAQQAAPGRYWTFTDE